jgi:uncharacterized membrane protein YdbT with pleckstrin-like domain
VCIALGGDAVDDDEITIWEGRPSHIKDLGFHSLCLLLAPLIVPLLLMLWRYLDTHFHRYGITNERLRVSKGILSKRMKEMELYRVRETSLDEPLFLRLFRLGNVVVTVADAAKPAIVIRAVPGASTLREDLRKCVETMRDKKRVHDVAFP